MTIQPRDKKALIILAVFVVLAFVLRFGFSGGQPAKVVMASDSVGVAEKRLARVRQLAASVPGKEQNLKRVAAELAQREKGLIQAATAPQAQAQVLEIVRRVAKAQGPPLEIKTGEIGQIRPLGESYGEVVVPVVFECRIEQLVQMMADLTAQRETLATSEVRITPLSPTEKTLSVRLTVSGVTPRALVPTTKGVASF